MSTRAASPADILLPRLDSVVKAGSGWRARCPAHGSHSQTLAIAEGEDGRLLLHCFAGCAVDAVLAAVDLTVSDLFVRRDLRTLTPQQRHEFKQAALMSHWHAALDTLAAESHVVLIAACQLRDGTPLSDNDMGRLHIAALRIFDAQEVLRAR